MRSEKSNIKAPRILRVFLPVVLLILVVLFPVSVHAQDLKIRTEEATIAAKVDYPLSYPGLLPDHPLYFVKTARDRIMSFFISNPVRKAEFDMQQADKRVAASLLLIKKGGKVALAQSTFSKGENYFEEALNKAFDAKTQGMEVSELAKKMKLANLKHIQVLSDIKNEMNNKDKNKFSTEHERLLKFQKRVSELSKKK